MIGFASASALSVKGGKKKTADLVFSKDMKGNPVWSLREAKVEDVPALCALGGELGRLGSPMVESLVSAQEPGCIVCEANVKGSKAGDGFKGVVLGGVITDLTTAVRDPSVGFSSGLMKRAEIIGVSVSQQMPDKEEVKKTLLLGSMKKAKMAGIDQIHRSMAADNKADFEMYKSIGFTAPQGAKKQVRGSNKKLLQLSVNTISINPDPKKKFS